MTIQPSANLSGSAAPRYGFRPGDIVVVTGAGSGIGRAVAKSAAVQELVVACWDRDARTLDDTVSAIDDGGGTAIPAVVDLTEPEQVKGALREASAVGTIRHIANIAGPSASAPLDFNTGLVSSVGSMRSVVDAWFTAGTPPGASLVNIASLAGVFQGASSDWYCAAKAGIVGWTRHLATHRSHMVRANVVAPGMTATPRTGSFADTDAGRSALARIPLGRMADPGEVAAVVLFLLSPLASYVHGAVVPVDGGWSITG